MPICCHDASFGTVLVHRTTPMGVYQLLKVGMTGVLATKGHTCWVLKHHASLKGLNTISTGLSPRLGLTRLTWTRPIQRNVSYITFLFIHYY